ncbi:hypothetical protein [Streptomyces sp. NPDC007988]|uniref:hypothetical protein n=1 Tax=Streptomyces sp. NPDC007988 TaxID=3364802 RepID=UPI0036DFCDF7
MRITDKPDPAADLVGQVLVLADLVDPAGVVRRAVRFRAGVDLQTAVQEPVFHERRRVRLLAAHVLRGAERVGDPVRRRATGDRRGCHRGPDGAGSSVSTAARHHWWDEASVGDEAGVAGPTGRPLRDLQALGRLARVVLGSSHEICDFER